MTIDEANKIVQIWGRYLEYMHGKLSFIFGTRIPESFLPFPLRTLEKAINIVAEHYHNIGDQESVKIIQSDIGLLTAYTDDEEALLQAAKFFNDLKWQEATLPAFKKFQKDWTKTQGDF